MRGVLFVCTANVCRSPLMATRFRELFAAEGWEVRSRGVDVESALGMCRVAERLVSTGSEGDDRLRSRRHHAEQLVARDVHGADLVVTASRVERARVATLDGESRQRSFTLLEAVALGRPAATADEIARMRQLVADGTAPLAAHADLLHRRRGRLPAPRVQRRAWRGSAVDPWDIPDVHHRNDRRHESVLSGVLETVDELSAQVGRTIAFIDDSGLSTPRSARA